MDKMSPTDANITNFILRPEYEARQAELQARITSLEGKIDGLGAKLDAMSLTLKGNTLQIGAVKFFGYTVVNLVTGAGVYILAQWILTGRF